jgi:hypothetical protein
MKKTTTQQYQQKTKGIVLGVQLRIQYVELFDRFFLGNLIHVFEKRICKKLRWPDRTRVSKTNQFTSTKKILCTFSVYNPQKREIYAFLFGFILSTKSFQLFQ